MSKQNNLTDFLTDVADAIRQKKGTQAPINPQDFSSEIASIPTGIEPTGTKQIRNNGEFNIREFEKVNVDVPGTTTKELFEATANGTYDIAEYAKVNVNVPNPSTGVLDITENGKYDVTEKAGVSVNVAGLVPTGNKQITTTAQTDVTAFATAQVVDANLVAGNIKKDVKILGILGTLEGGSDGLDELMQEKF